MAPRALLALALAPILACGGEDPSPADVVEVVPFPSTRVLSADALAALQAESGSGRLVFSPPPAGLTLEVGDVLVAGLSDSTPSGLLRLVTAVQAEGTALTVETVDAPLQLAFRRVHVRAQRDTGELGDATWSAAKGVGLRRQPLLDLTSGSAHTTQHLTVLLFDGDGDPTTEGDQIAFDGELGGGLQYRFGIDMNWGEVTDLPTTVRDCALGVLVGAGPACLLEQLVPEAKITFEVDPLLVAAASLHGSAVLDYAKDFDLGSVPLPPVGLGLLVFTPSVDIVARVEGSAAGAFSVGAHGYALFHSSVTLSSKHPESPELELPRLEDIDFTPEEPQVTLHAHAKAGVGARLVLSLYSVVGPYATARAFVALDADPLDGPCFTLRAGIDAELGVLVTSPNLPLLGRVTLADWRSGPLQPLELDVASGACTLGPLDAPALPPGAGPDARALAMPRFTPWAESLGGAVDGLAAAAPTADGTAWTEVHRTIDDRTVLAGAHAKGLVKIDGDGEVVWSRRYSSEAGGQALALVRLTDGTDGTLFGLAAASGLDPLSVVQLAQDGSPLARVALSADLPCDPQPVALARDGERLVALARCVDEQAALLFELTPSGADLRVLRDAQGRRLAPQALAARDGETFVVGVLRTAAGDRLFATRLSLDGTPTQATQVEGCPEAPDLAPTRALLEADGQIAVVGSAGGHRGAFLIAWRPDGALGFARFPGLGFGLSRVLTLTDVQALPTGGYVAVGSTVDLTGDTDRARTPTIFAAGLDAVGRIFWARDYALGAPGAWRPVAHPGLRLTDEGGALLAAVAADDGDGGAAWALHVRARDGGIDLDPARADAAPLAIQDLECAVESAPWAAEVTSTALAPSGLPVVATPITVSARRQTP